MKIIRKTLLTVAAAAMAVSLVSCTNKDYVTEKDIQKYLEKNFYDDDTYGEITKIEITDRETDAKEGEDEIWVTVTSETENRRYIKMFYLESKYSESRDAWKIKEFEKDDEDEWKVTPLQGATEDEILEALRYSDVTVDNETWDVDVYTAELTIEKQDTDLDDLSDSVDATVIIKDLAMQVECPVHIDMEYSDYYGWTGTNVEFGTPGTPEYIEGKQPETDYDTVIDYFWNQPFSFISESGVDAMPLDDEHISNFKAETVEPSYKGSIDKIASSFTYKDKIAEIDFNADIIIYCNTYGAWLADAVNYDPTIKSMNTKGDWVGSCTVDGTEMDLRISLSELGKEGQVSGTVTFSPAGEGAVEEATEPTTEAATEAATTTTSGEKAEDTENTTEATGPKKSSGKGGSFTVEGILDMDNGTLDLYQMDWIEQPEGGSMIDFHGIYNFQANGFVDDRGTEFIITKED